MIHLLTMEGKGIPPSLNNAYFNNRNGGRTMKEEIKAWKLETIALARQCMDTDDFSEHAKKPLAIKIKLWVPELYRSDWDGHVKVLQDAIMKAMGLNDAYIVQAEVTKKLSKDNPGFSVSLWRIE